eukprot:c12815_g2_i1.p1 GENE.c12815_g2_i1~~c12815_g2_i1.p1  ORF type:complete len:498 (-),score=137.56 c12815_g2_i1:45-1394(-)
MTQFLKHNKHVTTLAHNTHTLVNSLLANKGASDFIQHIASALAQHPKFATTVQTAIQKLSGEQSEHSSNSEVSLLQLKESDDSQQVGSCLFRTFEGLIFKPTAFQTVLTSKTQSTEECLGLCAQNTSCVAYDWNINLTCRLLSNFNASSVFDSAVCIRRGGCDGTGDDSECVWLPLPDTDVGAVLSVDAIQSDIPVASEEVCVALCEQYVGHRCIGYRYGKLGTARDQCTYYMQSSASVTSDSGICLRGMSFSSLPTKCWVNTPKCTNQPTVSVPESYGDPLVTLSVSQPVSVSAVINPASTANVRASSGVVTYTDIGFVEDGMLVLKATAEGVVCPAFSTPFLVDDAERHTLLRFQSGFPTDGPFWIIQPSKQCTTIVLVLVVLGLFAIHFAFKLVWSALFNQRRVPVVLVLLGILLVFLRDYGVAYDRWQCLNHFAASFQFLKFQTQ